MSKINKVLYNVNQRDSDPSKGNTREDMWMARNNIGLDEVIGQPTVTEAGKIYTGIAPLGTNGLVPTEYLPSFVNNVVDGYFYQGKFYSDFAHTTEISPDENTTYVDITTADMGVAYRYSTGSGEYFSIANQNAFGAVSDGTNTIHADKPMDLLTITGQGGVTVSVGDSGHSDTLTIAHSNQVSGGSGIIGTDSATSGITIAVPYANYDANGHITGKGTHTHTISSASTDGKGVVQLQNSIGANETNATKAVTPKSVRDAINNLNYSSVGGAGKYIQAISESNGLISATVETMDTAPTANSTKAITSGAVHTALASKSGTSHGHGNITSDGKVTTAAQTKKALLVTNSSNEVATGPAFGTATGDANLILNKEGNWVTFVGTTATTAAAGNHTHSVAVASTSGVGGSAGFMSAADKEKLDGISNLSVNADYGIFTHLADETFDDTTDLVISKFDSQSLKSSHITWTASGTSGIVTLARGIYRIDANLYATVPANLVCNSIGNINHVQLDYTFQHSVYCPIRTIREITVPTAYSITIPHTQQMLTGTVINVRELIITYLGEIA